MLRLHAGRPHFFADLPGSAGVPVQHEQDLAPGFHGLATVRRLHDLMSGAPFRGPVAGYLDIVEHVVLRGDAITVQIGDNAIEPPGDGAFPFDRCEPREQGDAVFRPQLHGGGIVHVQGGFAKSLIDDLNFFARGGSERRQADDSQGQQNSGAHPAIVAANV